MNNVINDKKFNDIMNRIQSRRIELKLSYQDLANKTGLSKSTLQRYETGFIRNIPLDKLEILANALEVSPMWIIGYDVINEEKKSNDINSNNKSNILLNDFNKLNEEGKDEAIKRVQELTELNKYKKDEDIKVIELPKKQIWEEEGKEHLMPIACHDDNLTDEEKDIVNERINDILKNIDKY